MAKTDEKIAIVGGGIAGLFCALELLREEKSVTLFETSDRFGGRIRTIRLDKNNNPLGNGWTRKDLEFYVEFGPMRVELDKQLLLKALLTHLEITRPEGEAGRDKAHLVDFPAYASPTSPHDAQYELRPEEEGKKPLELLQLALLRIIVRLEVVPVPGKENPTFPKKKKELIDQITVAAATMQPVDRIFLDWIKGRDGNPGLTEQHLWEIQTQGQIDKVPLYSMGFWNLVSDYLSHNATLKLRDLGTFYHLLPENPNAAEWLVWWLIGFAISEKLQGIFGGMQCIVDKLEEKLTEPKCLYENCWVKSLEKTANNKLKLIFDDTKTPTSEIASQEYDRVILALPKRAIQDIVGQSQQVFSQEPELKGLLDSAFGFPMVKTFVVVKNRWWENEHRPNWYATRVPTRELHYWNGKSDHSRQGLIMAYTDSPAAAFWANYVPPGPQIDAHRARIVQPGDKTKEKTGHKTNEEKEKPLPEETRQRLVKKIAGYLNDNELPDITSDDIVWYGIRDWGREPYGGANHAWRPERKYWVVMRRLADIPVLDDATGKSTASIHICGEAYSDYHGFMEGSLRSAVYVLHRILDRTPDGTFNRLPWLLEEDLSDENNPTNRKELRVKKDYLIALHNWVANLDAVKQTDTYL